MDSETTVVCRHCRKPVRINELRQEEGSWICQDCYEKAHFYPEPKKTSFKEEDREPKSVNLASKPGAKVYSCGNCGYHLERDYIDKERVCPYCGDKGTMRIMQ